MDQENEAYLEEKMKVVTYAIKRGYMVLPDENQDLQLTVKGKVATALLGLMNIIKQSDQEGRDFTTQEQLEALEAVEAMQRVLSAQTPKEEGE